MAGNKAGRRSIWGHDKTRFEANLEWTFPLAFAEIISGDGRVYRQRVDPLILKAGHCKLHLPLDLKGRTWVRPKSGTSRRTERSRSRCGWTKRKPTEDYAFFTKQALRAMDMPSILQSIS